MQQDSLWGTMAAPLRLECATAYNEVTNGHDVIFRLYYSKALEGNKLHVLRFQLEEFERDAVQMMHWAADRYFWRNRFPRIVNREIGARLKEYRDHVDRTRIPTSGFHEVDFG